MRGSRRELPDPLSLTWTLELDVSGRVVACLLPAAPGQPGAFGGGGDGQSYVLAYTVVVSCLPGQRVAVLPYFGTVLGCWHT